VGQSVEVVVSELHLAAGRLDDAAQRLRDGLASVDDETTQLLGSGWKGGAASAYGPEWKKWHDGAEQVVTGLQRMSELLTIAGKEYAKTDESGSEALDSTVQGSGGSAGSGGGTAGGQGLPDLGLGGGPSGTAGGNAGGQSGDGVQQAMSSASQLGQAAVQPLTQVGQAAAGFVQQAAQLAAGLAQQAAQAQSDQGDEATERDAEGTDGRERPDESEKRDDEPESAAAPSDEQSAGTAPVGPAPADRNESRLPSDQAIKRTR
jgi:WXG100 family type VII secretion target